MKDEARAKTFWVENQLYRSIYFRDQYFVFKAAGEDQNFGVAFNLTITKPKMNWLRGLLLMKRKPVRVEIRWGETDKNRHHFGWTRAEDFDYPRSADVTYSYYPQVVPLDLVRLDPSMTWEVGSHYTTGRLADNDTYEVLAVGRDQVFVRYHGPINTVKREFTFPKTRFWKKVS